MLPTPRSLPIVIVPPIPAGVVERFTPGNTTRVILVREGIELSRLHQRTGECQQHIKKLPIPPSLNPSPCNEMIKQGKDRMNSGFPIR